ncbi:MULTISPECIES: aldehyde dehydrogenase family protein [unclassified Pseudomonas]|uniref:aldehyde dehydrogenase family protein n=1 Tax=Pseudomonas TaxID=286 RepID=UPI001CE42F92
MSQRLWSAPPHVVDSEEEGIELANAAPFGLSGYLFDADTQHARQVTARIDSATVYINELIKVAEVS